MADKGFREQIGTTLDFEGGYVNDPDDAGGETNFGITRRSYPNLDIANLTMDDAIAIYKRDFWDKPKLGRLADPVGAKVFDLSVNMGLAQAVRLLQRAVNAHGLRVPLIVDGRLGPLTVKAASTIDNAALVDLLRVGAAGFYQAIVRNKPSQEKFLKGWLRRARA